MGNGLLESLKKYRPRYSSMSMENFVTEAFAWLLKSNPDFSMHFLSLINAKSGMCIEDFEPNRFEWETQPQFGGVFPDMVAYCGDSVVLIFEHKLGSSLQIGQLDRYREYAKKYEVQRVVLITASISQHGQNPDLALCWSNIYEIISHWLKENTEVSFIFEDFLQLLESEGLGMSAPISQSSIIHYYSSKDLKRNIGQLLKRVENEDWSRGIREGYQIDIDTKRGGAYGEAWGRMGISILGPIGSWSPGIFIGFLLDGEDHSTIPSDSSKGPDFCLILDIDREYHDVYASMNNYKILIRQLYKHLSDNIYGWEFYNHLEDTSVRRKNKWHPFHIRKPMLDVFSDSSTLAAQEAVFMENSLYLLGLVTQEDSFWGLRADLIDLKKTNCSGCGNLTADL